MTFYGFLSSLIWAGLLFYVLRRYQEQIKNILETFKEWTQVNIGKWFGAKRNSHAATTSPPEPTGKTLPELGEGISDETQKVVSTLWKHQKEYYPPPDQTRKGRWSFIVGFGNPNYADYLLGVGEGLKKGLVTVDPRSGQCILTDAGIYYCEHNEGKLLSDWDFERWKK